mgnify:CR=1 FL=1
MTHSALYIKIGRRRYQVDSLRQASDMYCAARDASGMGASRVPEAMVLDAGGTPVARISYNGRVWPPEPWRPGMQPLLDNRDSHI